MSGRAMTPSRRFNTGMVNGYWKNVNRTPPIEIVYCPSSSLKIRSIFCVREIVPLILVLRNSLLLKRSKSTDRLCPICNAMAVSPTRKNFLENLLTNGRRFTCSSVKISLCRRGIFFEIKLKIIYGLGIIIYPPVSQLFLENACRLFNSHDRDYFFYIVK